MDVSISSSNRCHLSAQSPPPPHTAAAARMQLPKSTCFQGGRKEEVSVISRRTRELFQCAWVEHVFIFTVRYEGLGTRHPAVSLWAPNFHSTQPQLRSTRSRLIPFYKPNMTNNCIVYCWIPLGRRDSVRRTAAVPLTALCYVCSEAVMICIDHR